MKKLILAILALSCLSACKKDDDSVSSPIAGVWKEGKTVVYSGTDNAVISTQTPDDCALNSTYQFSNDGLYTVSKFYYSNEVCTHNDPYTKIYTYDAGTNILEIEGESEKEVLSATETELQILLRLEDKNNDEVLDKVVWHLYK